MPTQHRLPPNITPIDVDERKEIDLTLPPPTIDLTSDIDIDLSQDEVVFLTPVVPRAKILPFQRALAGPPSSITYEIPRKRSAGVDVQIQGPSTKKQRRGSTVAPGLIISKRSVTPQALGVKRDVIELDSDGEETLLGRKKLKREPSVSSDEDTDHEWLHAGFDLSNPLNWKPDPNSDERFEPDILGGMRRLSLTSFSPQERGYVDISERKTTSHITSPSTFVWEALQQIISTQSHHSIKRLHRPSTFNVNKNPGRSNIIPQFRCLASFKKAPGSINKIVQSGALVGICSASIGGHPDNPDEEEDPYNWKGSFMIWNETLQTFRGHKIIKNKNTENEYTKYYTVNDIKADPGSSSFVSSGNDKTVKIWRWNPDKAKFKICSQWEYNHVPHELAFKPGESVLAVAQHTISIYSDLSSSPSSAELRLLARMSPHCVGAMIWGLGPTSSHLFASSEPFDNDDLTGVHKAFDVERQRVVHGFDAHEAGDAMSITQDGAKLALITRGADSTHILRLYDIHRRDSHAIKTVQLRPFPERIEGEVNSAAFSPNGIHLALGRNDNHIHIYDSRMLNKLLFDYEHFGPPRMSPGSDSYGVVQVQWVDSDAKRLPIGLVTGGNDGCVRFWDPFKGADDPINGHVLVEMNSDIAHFSLGDWSRGERDLVVGDCAGGVSIFEVSRRGILW